MAASLGAVQYIDGSVVRDPRGLTITASLTGVRDGRVEARAHAKGPPDSISALIDQLAAQLLGLQAGLRQDRVSSIANVNPVAIRAFVAGRA